MTTRINTADSHAKWAVVTASQGTSAEYCIACFDTKREAIDRMNEVADDGENADVMLTAKALKMYSNCVIQ